MATLGNKKVSAVVIRRLPRYYRYLGELLSNKITRISSAELSRRMGVTASQIRQDLNCFGGFGQQGYGYNVENLYMQMGKILGLSKKRKMIIVGAGNLGHAIANYANFEKRGFTLCGIFDNDKKKTQGEIAGMQIQHIKALETFIKEKSVDIAVLCVPKPYAQGMAERLARAGIKGIWNFSYTELLPPQGVVVETVHLSDSLMTLSCRINQETNET